LRHSRLCIYYEFLAIMSSSSFKMAQAALVEFLTIFSPPFLENVRKIVYIIIRG